MVTIIRKWKGAAAAAADADDDGCVMIAVVVVVVVKSWQCLFDCGQNEKSRMTHLRTGARPLHQHTTQFPSCAEPDFGLGFTAPSPKPIALWSFEVRAIRKVLDLELCVLELGGSCEVPASTRPL